MSRWPRRVRFNAYPSAFAGGVFVAGGGLSGYAGQELVTGAGPTAMARVAINQFPPAARRVPHQFTAYEATFRGGVRLAVGDVDGDGRAELITAPGPGRKVDLVVRTVVL